MVTAKNDKKVFEIITDIAGALGVQVDPSLADALEKLRHSAAVLNTVLTVVINKQPSNEVLVDTLSKEIESQYERGDLDAIIAMAAVVGLNYHHVVGRLIESPPPSGLESEESPPAG